MNPVKIVGGKIAVIEFVGIFQEWSDYIHFNPTLGLSLIKANSWACVAVTNN